LGSKNGFPVIFQALCSSMLLQLQHEHQPQPNRQQLPHYFVLKIGLYGLSGRRRTTRALSVDVLPFSERTSESWSGCTISDVDVAGP
jgi:hypothetical protein